MDECTHPVLLLLQPEARKRCRHCHLTLRAAELAAGHCPECYARDGRRRRDFEDVAADGTPSAYRCDRCGVLIEAG